MKGEETQHDRLMFSYIQYRSGVDFQGEIFKNLEDYIAHGMLRPLLIIWGPVFYLCTPSSVYTNVLSFVLYLQGYIFGGGTVFVVSVQGLA